MSAGFEVSVQKVSYKEKVAIAGVLAGLSAVPISLGLATSNSPAHIGCLAVGVGLWVTALVLLLPSDR